MWSSSTVNDIEPQQQRTHQSIRRPTPSLLTALPPTPRGPQVGPPLYSSLDSCKFWVLPAHQPTIDGGNYRCQEQPSGGNLKDSQAGNAKPESHELIKAKGGGAGHALNKSLVQGELKPSPRSTHQAMHVGWGWGGLHLPNSKGTFF